MRKVHVRALLSLILLTGSLFGSSVMAVEVRGLYEAEVPVFSQAREERNTAIQTAFIEVLVRISGRSAVGSVPGLAEVVQQGKRYVQQYRYRKVTQTTTVPEGTESYDQVLWVRFSENAVNSLLRQFGLPVWGSTRPATLVWVVVDEGKGRQLLSNDTQHPIRDLLDEWAARRGVPLQFPLYDLQDRSALRASDVWGNFEDAILAASSRYAASAVLGGRVYRGFGGVWHGRWSLYSAGRRFDWEFRSTELADVVKPGIEQTAEMLSIRFAQVQHEQETNIVTVKVLDVRNLADYNRTIEYLSRLSGIEKVQPQFLSSDTATFKLKARSGRLGVAQAVSLGHILVAELPDQPNTAQVSADGSTSASSSVSADLIYRLVP